MILCLLIFQQKILIYCILKILKVSFIMNLDIQFLINFNVFVCRIMVLSMSKNQMLIKLLMFQDKEV